MILSETVKIKTNNQNYKKYINKYKNKEKIFCKYLKKTYF